ncbi:MAG: hypothetical protein Q8922_00950 [Bacteroidota bacterium]|nr:hypothetical protein [Bacteroidota bacterium]MDP4232601.1 hypothetical protein [Bacteroidota bacterium]MDP4242945.1 hypothetical protein [Bacteroidota bacterium]MDP4286480.1 hypothetical protein [Bacteroidota bacterium]
MRAASLILFSFLFVGLAEAQSVSPVASFEFGSPLFISRAPGAYNHAKLADTGVSSAFSVGLGVQATMRLMGPIGLIGRIEGVYTTGEFLSIAGGDTISGHEWKLVAEALAEWSASGISLRLGPWVSERVLGKVNRNGVDVATMSAPFHFGAISGFAIGPAGWAIQPELTARVDLSQLQDAGANAWSIGISLAYPITASEPSVTAPERTVEPTAAEPIVKFLVNRALVKREVPLERVKQFVKQYTMSDSANDAPIVKQWVVESYHLPQLAVLVEMEGGVSGDLTISKDTLKLMQTSMTAFNRAGVARDTTELDTDPGFLEALAHLNIGAWNTLVAEFRSSRGSAVVRDTLILPPVDTNGKVRTVEKKQLRFEFSLNYAAHEGGNETLGLLLDRMKSLAQPSDRITILKPRTAELAEQQRDLTKRITDALGDYAKNAEYQLTDSNPGRIIVVLDS